MTDKVVSLHGGEVPEALSEMPVREVVDMLEKHLQLARLGKIRSAAIVSSGTHETILDWSVDGAVYSCVAMVGWLDILHSRMRAWVNQNLDSP